MIVANGLPKSGTHALMRVLKAQGLKRAPGLYDGMRGKAHIRPTKAFRAPTKGGLDDSWFVHGHVPAAYDLDCWVITIFRDPRNVAVSCARAYLGGDVAKVIREFQGASIVKRYRSFLGWRLKALTVRYEDICEAARRLPANLYQEAVEDHDTYTGSPSDWREWWNSEAEDAWRKAGGYDLLFEAGYA